MINSEIDQILRRGRQWRAGSTNHIITFCYSNKHIEHRLDSDDDKLTLMITMPIQCNV